MPLARAREEPPRVFSSETYLIERDAGRDSDRGQEEAADHHYRHDDPPGVHPGSALHSRTGKMRQNDSDKREPSAAKDPISK